MRTQVVTLAVVCSLIWMAVLPAKAQLVDDIVGFLEFTRFSEQLQGTGGGQTTLNVINDFPNTLTIEESDMVAPGFNLVNNPLQDQGIDPDGDGDITTTIFERNSHLFFFQREGDKLTFDRNEGLDLGYTFVLDTPNPTPRKEAGLMFRALDGVNSQYIATSNDTLFGSGPGEITAFGRDLPGFNFSRNFPGDFNDDRRVDAADYTIWRDTLGSTEDLRANDDNSGDSEGIIDAADYQVWVDNFGTQGQDFNVGDSIRMRLIYTPPEIDENIPFDPNEPGANVLTPGTMEYIISVNDGPLQSSGPLAFTNAWRGIPDSTSIVARAQFQSFPNLAPDSATVIFSDFDLDGPDVLLAAGNAVPEPANWCLGAGFIAAALLWGWRRESNVLRPLPQRARIG